MNYLLEVLPPIVKRLREISPLYDKQAPIYVMSIGLSTPPSRVVVSSKYDREVRKL